MNEYEEYVANQLLKARVQKQEQAAEEGSPKDEHGCLIDKELWNEETLKCELIETSETPVTETATLKSWQPSVNEMFDRAGKGDVDFDKPTREEQEANAKAYFESQEPQPQPIDPKIIEKLFARAKKGEG